MKHKYEGKRKQSGAKRPRYMNADIQAIKKAFDHADSQTFINLENSLQHGLDMDTVATLLRKIAMYLQQNKQLSDDIKNPLSKLVTIAFSNLEYQLQPSNADMAFSLWLFPIPLADCSQQIAFLIYNCAQIAGNRLDIPAISASALVTLLQELAQLFLQTSKAIANSLYGIGLLTKADKLKGVIDGSVIQSLLNKFLILPDLIAQNISNSLYGLGLLAAAGQLHGSMHVINLLVLFGKLSTFQNLNFQDIHNSLYGLNLLEKSGQLEEDMAPTELQILLSQLSGLQVLAAQDISNNLYDPELTIVTPSQGKSAIPQPLYTTSKTPSKTPAPQRLIRANTDYEYASEDIQAILVDRVRDYANVHVLAAAQMNVAINGNGVDEVLGNFMKEQKELLAQSDERCKLLVPVQDDGHWVGLMVELEGKDIQRLTYFNSLNQKEADTLRMATIQTRLLQKGLMGEVVTVQPAKKALKQCDGTSCGPVMIENFYCALKGKWWAKGKNPIITQADTRSIRKSHLEVLRTYRPDYYPSFQTRKTRNTVSAPAMATQLQSHGLFPVSSAGTQQKQSIKKCRMAPIEKDELNFNIRKRPVG